MQRRRGKRRKLLSHEFQVEHYSTVMREARVAAARVAAVHVHNVCTALRRADLEPRIVTGVGTETAEIDAASRVYTELQTGSYVFMDVD